MRITIESFRNPLSSHIFSTFPINTGKYWAKVRGQCQGAKGDGQHTRSDSAMASPNTSEASRINIAPGLVQRERNIPHVGNATQADDDNLKPL
jgi:hypothetical protein